MHMGSSPIVRTNAKKESPNRGALFLRCDGRCAALNPCRLTELQNLQLVWRRQRRMPSLPLGKWRRSAAKAFFKRGGFAAKAVQRSIF